MKNSTRNICLTASLLAFGSTALAQPYTYVPKDLAGAGLSYVVRDTMIWYGNTNHLTVGPVNVGDQLGNNANWEPYCGVLGDSAFLLGYCSYAPDGVANPDTAPDDPGQSPRKLNDPQAALAFTLAGTDAEQFGNAPSPENQETVTLVPPPPALASEAYGTELTELYWCSLLRDVAFTDYGANVVAGEAAQELTSMPTYAGPRDGSGKVTPDLLFRGTFPGETVGPYLSQFYIQPTNMGAQSMDQRMITYVPNLDYMTDIGTWGDVQNGIPTGLANQPDPTPRYLHDGRGLAAFTHVDELYQAYFVAGLLTETLNAPKNPENPYSTSQTQQGFGTFGGPDFASTLAEVAKIALNAVWYQKWNVHLRHRPESGGGIVQLIKMGQGGTLDGAVNNNVLNSKALQASSSKYGGSFLLSQAFPEGSPAHPAYPTGHGTVGGACITILKFFFWSAFAISCPI